MFKESIKSNHIMQKLALILAALITSIITTAQERTVQENQGEIGSKSTSTKNLECRHNDVIIHSKDFRAKSYNCPMAWVVRGTSLQIANFPKIGWIGVELLGKWNRIWIHSWENAPFQLFANFNQVDNSEPFL